MLPLAAFGVFVLAASLTALMRRRANRSGQGPIRLGLDTSTRHARKPAA